MVGCVTGPEDTRVATDTVKEAWEHFSIGGEKVGLIYRYTRQAGREIEGIVINVFGMGGQIMAFRHDHTYRRGEGLPDWSGYRFQHPDGTVSVKRSGDNLTITTASGSRTVAGTDDAIPSYLTYAVVPLAVVRGPVTVSEMTDGEPDERERVTYRSLGPDAGNGGLIKVVQYRDGEPGNGFWLQDDEILKSDWGGAVSTRAEGPAAARTGLPPGVEEAFERIRSSP